MRTAGLDPSFSREARGRRFSGRSGRLIAAASAAAIAALLAACAPAASPSLAPSRSPVASASIAPASPSTASAFPLTLTDDEGTSVTISAEPQRLVSLTPGTTEILFALGIGDRILATDSASDYPAAAVELPDVAAFGTVDAEKIVGLEADLVIAGGNGYTPPDGVTKLRSLGIPVLVVYAATVAGVSGDVELVGKAVGRAAQSTELAAAMRADIAALAATAASQPKPRTFYEVDATHQIYGPADRSFLAEMVGLAGGAPVASGSADNFEIPLERLIAADPEVIILGDAAFGTTADAVAKRPGWGVMTAVRAGAVRVADDKLITRPGPRLAQGLRSLILAIHPGAALP
jgi:iron complex transport system substrate-binding protein